MKTIKMILVSSLFVLILLTQASLYAQDPMKASANVYKKILLENEKARVMEVEFKPGTTAAWHSHPNHTIYALTNGKIVITEKGKTAMPMEIKAGTALYMPAVTHMAKNVGTTTIKLIVTEMKPMMQKKLNSTMTPTKKK